MFNIWLVIACSGDDDTSSKELGEIAAMMSGTITTEGSPDGGDDLTGEFSIYRAYAFNAQVGNSQMMGAYLSSNKNATCDTVAEYLNVSGEAYNPENVLSPGKCNMFIKLTADYEDGISLENDSMAAISSGITCAMGEGEFSYSELGENDIDYFWTGELWTGNVENYSWDIEGNVESGYTLDISMSTYTGFFTQSALGEFPASGTVSGTVTAEACAGIFSTGHFQ